MKKIKRIVALVCAMVMMMAMSTISFAATGSAKITVNGLVADEVQDVYIYEVATTVNAITGTWKFASWVTDEMYSTKTESGVTSYTYDWAKMQAAVEGGLQEDGTYNAAVVSNASKTCAEGSTSVEFTGLTGASYLVLVKTTTGETVYNVMGAKTYEYDTDTAAYKLKDATLTAKYTTIPTTKTANDQFVHAGETVTFTITSYMPGYDADNKLESSFVIYDYPTNLSNLEITGAKIGAASIDFTHLLSAVKTDKDGKAYYEMDLSSYISETNAGKKVEITMTGVVNGNNGYENTAYSNKNTNNPSTVKGYTGDITITKYAKDTKKALAGAKFKIAKVTKDKINKDVLNYVKFSTVHGSNSATYIYDDTNGIDEIEVSSDGKLKVTGLDEGTYRIIETVAPEGYQINNNISDVTITADNTQNVSTISDVYDTQLASLPMTGGMGTTLFTVIGVAVMVLAAALYLANKKKNAAN